MSISPKLTGALLACALAISALHAASDDSDESDMFYGLKPGKNQFSFGYFHLSGLKVKFSNLGIVPPNVSPAPASAGETNRFYNDGSVRIDVNGNPNGVSTAFTYANTSQVTPSDLIFHSYSSVPSTGAILDTPKQSGSDIELRYERPIASIAPHFEWGVQAIFGFTGLSSKVDNVNVVSNLVTQTDFYRLNGFDLLGQAGAPYTSVNDGTGPSVSSRPRQSTTTTIQDGTIVRGSYKIHGAVYDMRFGPTLIASVGQHLQFQVSAGASVMYLSTDFTSNEVLTPPGNLGTIQYLASSNKSKFIPGGYAEFTIKVWVTERTGFYAGVEYQANGKYTQPLQGRLASVDIGSSTGFQFGITTRF